MTAINVFDAVVAAIDNATIDLPKPIDVTDAGVTGAPRINYASYDDMLAWIDRGLVYPCGDFAHHNGGLVAFAVLGTLPGGWYVTVTAPLPGGE